jgi:hypothetical protein
MVKQRHSAPFSRSHVKERARLPAYGRSRPFFFLFFVVGEAWRGGVTDPGPRAKPTRTPGVSSTGSSVFVAVLELHLIKISVLELVLKI